MCFFKISDAAKKFNAAEAPVPSEMGAQGTTGAAPGGQPAIPEGNFDPQNITVPSKKFHFSFIILQKQIWWEIIPWFFMRELWFNEPDFFYKYIPSTVFIFEIIF